MLVKSKLKIPKINMNNLQDTYNRIHNYLRISLTDSCNFRCLYCMPEENMQCLSQKDLMHPQEIFTIAKTFVDYNVNKIRLTGGEPLVRHDFSEIVQCLAQLPVKLTLTTNGVLIHKYVDLFKNVGIKSINISIDSLNESTFKSITKRNALSQVWKNIHLLVKENFHVKLNVVAMRGVNEHEITDFVNLTCSLPLQVRFIEFMPFSGNRWEKNRVLTTTEMLHNIEKHFSINKLQDSIHNTAKTYQVLGSKGTFAFITTMSQPFCSGCNRMRITADGKMKNCLFGKEEFDILGELRAGRNIKPVIENCVYKKHKKMGKQFQNFKNLNPDHLENRSMIKIGG